MSTQPPKWNVMIFLAGNNSLSEECVYGLTDVLDAKINDNISVFAQLSTGVHRGTFLDLRKFKDRDQLHKKLNSVLSAQHKAERAKQQELAKKGETELHHHDRSFAERIFQYVKKCVDGKPADHHMLILAGHGSGTFFSSIAQRLEASTHCRTLNPRNRRRVGFLQVFTNPAWPIAGSFS